MRKLCFTQFVCCILLGALMAIMPVVSVLACSCNVERQWGFLSSEGILPGNARGLLWHSDFFKGLNLNEEPPVQIYDASGALVPAAFEMFSPMEHIKLWLVRPAGGCKPGDTYRFETHQSYPDKRQSLKVTFSRDTVKSPSGPTLYTIGKPRLAWASIPMGVSCRDHLPSMQVSVEMVIPPKLRAFKNQFYYETFVDGRRWYPATSMCSSYKPGVSWNDKKGSDILFTACSGGQQYEYGLSPGEHKVELRASLPGTDFKMLSRQMTIEMACPTYE